MSRQDRFSWFSRQQRRRPSGRRKSLAAAPYARRLHLEKLEDRRVLAPVVGFGSGTEAVFERSADFDFGNAANFESSGFTSTISLSGDGPSDLSGFRSITTELTFEAWFQVDTLNPAADSTIFSRGLSIGTDDSRVEAWSVEIDTNGFLRFRIQDIQGGAGLGQSFEIIGTTNVGDGEFYHVQATIDDQGTMQLFLDGDLEASMSVTLSPAGLLPISLNDPLIGNRSDTSAEPFDGLLDEIRIWNVDASEVPNRFAALSGDEAGLVAYFDFNEGLADQSVNAIEVLGATNVPLVDSLDTPVTGFVELVLTDSMTGLPVQVTDSPGIIVNYLVTDNSVVQLGSDFFVSQLDLDTTGGAPPSNAVFIAEGESSARISFAALADFIDEGNETVSITLQEDTDPFGLGGTRYTTTGGAPFSFEIRETDAFVAGLAAIDVVGQDATSVGIDPDASGAASLSVQLTSQPTADVTISLGSDLVAGTLSTGSLTFTASDWNVSQEVLLSGLSGLVTDDDVVDVLGAIELQASSTDNNFVFTESVTVFDSEDNVQLQVTEGADPQTILPTVRIQQTSDATEGDTNPGVFTVSSDLPAPAGGLRVFYSVTEGAGSLDTQFNIVNDLGAPRFVDIPAGQLSTSVLITAIDDSIAESALAVGVELEFGATTPAGDLGPGQSLTAGGDIFSPDGTRRLVFQGDGNFVVRVPGGVVTWASGTNGLGADSVTIQSDGNLVIRNGATTVYQTNSASDPNSFARLHVTNAGQPMIFRADGAKLWEGTLGSGNGSGTIFTPDALQLPYQISPTLDSAQLSVIDNDFAALETAQLTNIASLDTNFETSVDVPALFDFDITSFTQTATGTTVTIDVRIVQAPSTGVVLTLFDANSDSSQTLTFDPGDFDGDDSITGSDFLSWQRGESPNPLSASDLAAWQANFGTTDFSTVQTVTLNLSQATDGGLDLIATTDANGDSNFNNLNITLPFRQIAVPFDFDTFLATSETGDDFRFGVRLTSEPIADVAVTLDVEDTTEGQLSAVLDFDNTNWDVFQVVTVVAQDDAVDDDNVEFVVTVGAASADLVYDALSADFDLTNQDDETDANPLLDISNDSPIIASLTPVVGDAGEASGSGRFEITLSEPAPEGGLTVSYAIFQGSATFEDIDVPAFSERFADDNPLSTGQIEITGAFAGIVTAISLSFGDIDNDNDFDALLSLTNGTTQLFENTGTAEVPDFVINVASNPLASTSGEGSAFGDVDNDGDLDVIQVDNPVGAPATIRYFENQLVETGTLGFVEQIGALNPFDGLSLSNAAQMPVLVDIDNDGQLELFVTNSTLGLGNEFFEFAGGVYVASVENPLVGQGTVSSEALHFADFDTDGDFDAFIGTNLGIRFLENIGTATSPEFLQRTGVLNPVSNVGGTELSPFLVDIDGDNQLELFATESISQNEIQSIIALRFFEQTNVQEVFFSEGVTSVIVDIPVIDDSIDESTESFEVGLVSQLAQSFDILAADDFDNEFDLLVTGAFDGSDVTLEIDPTTLENFIGTTLQAGTVLSFSGGAVAVVDGNTSIDTVTGSISVSVTLNPGVTTIGVGEQATTTLNGTNGEIALLLDSTEVEFLALASGTQLTFSNGAVFEVSGAELLGTELEGDFDGTGTVDGGDLDVFEAQFGSGFNGADFLTFQRQFGVTDPRAVGVLVGGSLISGATIPSGATATITQAGYRVRTNLLVTDALSGGGSVGLLIDETVFDSLILPSGTLLQFEGGAIATVDADTLLNNSTGTAVAVTLTETTESQTIATGEGTSTSDFSQSVTLVVTGTDGLLLDGLLALATAPGDNPVTLVPGDQIVFNTPGGVVILNVVFGGVINASGGEVTVSFDPASTSMSLNDGANEDDPPADTTEFIAFEFVSSLEITLEDNDTAGVTLTPSGTTTTEDGGAVTIDVVLDSQPLDVVTLFIGTDATEALLSDDDESGQSFIQLLFTPNNWDVPQQIVAAGVNDDVDDGNVNYRIRTTPVSNDVRYRDDTVELRPSEAFNITAFTAVSFVLDEIVIDESTVPDNTAFTVLSFANGLQLNVNPGTVFTNSEPTVTAGSSNGLVDTLGTNELAVVNDGDELTLIEVTSAFSVANGSIGLRIDSAETSVLSATLLAGRRLIFSNGVVASLDEDVALSNSAETIASVTLLAGTAISTVETSFFEENLTVTTAFDAEAGTEIGLSIDGNDPLLGSVTFAAGTEFEFSNGAVATLDAQTTFTSDESLTTVTINPTLVTTNATAQYTEQLVEDLVFSNTDNDGAGISVTQTDPTIALLEGFSNNFFTVVLESEPTADVEIVLDPSDDNLRLFDEFMGESISIFFDAENWNVPQTIEVSAVDDSILEFDHLSTISFTVNSDDTNYSTITPADVEVFIEDDELPIASVIAVAGAIEASSPGFFVIELDQPAPVGPGLTGIEVTYTLGGTADADQLGTNTEDVQPISQSVVIPPGRTRSPLIAFPIDDFLAEGLDLVLTVALESSESSIELALDVEPFTVGAGGFNSSNGTVDLILQSRVADTGETTILSQGTVLSFSNGATATVEQNIIVSEDAAVAVSITLDSGTIAVGNTVFQQIDLPTGTELRLPGGVALTTAGAAGDPPVTLTNEQGTAVALTLDSLGASLAAGDVIRLQGESLTVTLEVSDDYALGTNATAGISILDNDRPGVRVLQVGDATTVAEGEEGEQLFISLLSQPEPGATVTIDINPIQATQFLELDQTYTSADSTVGLQIVGAEVDSLLLPAGTFSFAGGNITLATATTIFAGRFTEVENVTVTGTVGTAADTAEYTYDALSIAAGEDQLVFNASNWFVLQPVTVFGLDDLVVEGGELHFSDLGFTVTSTDPNYNGFEVPDLSVEIIDRRFDSVEISRALAQGFLALQDSIDSIELPILGNFGEVAPSFIDIFLEDVVTNIRETENLTTETLGESFSAAINDAIGGAIEVDNFSFEVTNIAPNELSFLLLFEDSLMEMIELNSNLGLEALNISIETEGAIELNVDFGVSLAFGISLVDGFFIDTEETSFEVTANLQLDEEFSATGELGFIQLDIANGEEGTGVNAEFVVTLEDEDDQRLTLAELVSNRDGSPFDFISYGFSGGAVLDLDVNTSVNGNAAFPSFSFNLFSDLPLLNFGNQDEAGSDDEPTLTVTSGFSGAAVGEVVNLTLEAGEIESGNARITKGTELTFGSDRVIVNRTTTIASEGTAVFEVEIVDGTTTIAVGEETSLESGAFNIAFNDITLDLGGFVNDLLGPIVTSINDVIEPFQPIIEVLTSEIEVLSTLGLAGLFDSDDDGEATLVEVALFLAGGFTNGDTSARFSQFVNAVSGVIELTESLSALNQSIAAGETIAINFGSYELQNFNGGSSTEDASTVDVETAGTANGPGMAPEDQTQSTGNNRVSNFFGGLSDIGVSLDIIENPLSVIQFLLGQDIDLVTWDVPELDLSFIIEQTFPVFTGIEGVLGGEFNVSSDLVFGFDTFGLSRWQEEDFALDQAHLIFDGFFISDVDPDTGEDVDELTLEATIEVGVQANAVVAQIRATGGITGTAGLDLIDVGEFEGESDGRIRGSEIISRISRPLELFQISGSVEAFVNLVVTVGIDVGFFSITEVVFEQELARITLFEFEIGGGGGSGSGALAASSVVLGAQLDGAPVETLAASDVGAPALAPLSNGPATEPVAAAALSLDVPQLQTPSLATVQSSSEPVSASATRSPTEIAPSPALARNELVDLALAFALEDRTDFVRQAKTTLTNPVFESEANVDLWRRYDDVTRPMRKDETSTIETRRDDAHGDYEERSHTWEDAFDEVFGEELETV